jgi:exodeoxyribonuclease VII large subunit
MIKTSQDNPLKHHHLQTNSILCVSDFTNNIKQILDTHFSLISITGELSNLATPRSGHWYFTLKDQHSQIRCAMFRHNNKNLEFVAEEGIQIVITARVSFYQARGDFQLIVETIKETGLGALQQAYEQLKQKLQTQGLFSSQRKQELPAIPRCLGIISSSTGAVLQDILNILQRRFPALPIIIYPAQVQGDNAPKQLIKALQQAEDQALCDVLIIGRGGGSMEDLWAFNDEQLVLAISDCPIAIISSVGHEVDFTLCDFVADKRVSTPSEAAELVSPDQLEWLTWLETIEKQLIHSIHRLLDNLTQQLNWQSKPFIHSDRYFHSMRQPLDTLFLRLKQTMNNQQQKQQQQLSTLNARLQQYSPLPQLNQQQAKLIYLHQRLKQAIHYSLKQYQQTLAALAKEMHALSPLATLGRGYSIIKNEQQHIIQSTQQLTKGQQITVHFSANQAILTVDQLITNQPLIPKKT